MTKTFDCIQMKRQGAERVREITGSMTFEERVRYWEKRSDELEERMKEARKRPDAAQKLRAAS